MFNYELYIDDVLIREGDENEFNEIAKNPQFRDIFEDSANITKEADIRASVEGLAIGYFMQDFVSDPVYPDLKALTSQDFILGSGLVISMFMEFLPKVRIEISETLN